MEIILGGYRKCNLYVGGDRRDKSLQDIIEGTEHKEFFLKKLEDGTLEISQVTHVLPITHKTKKEAPDKKRKSGVTRKDKGIVTTPGTE